MRYPHWKPETIAYKSGLRFDLSFEHESQSPSEHFIGECQWSEEQYAEISNNVWFCAKVAAKLPGGQEIGTSYLGACCYATKAEVMADKDLANILSGYAKQMVEEALAEAEKWLEDNNIKFED